ncbi:MAG: hypothetical protein WCX12_02190 [Candidatus Paceibacterota bacterium]|jgi:aminoglycoside phosphotransferase family enzyme
MNLVEAFAEGKLSGSKSEIPQHIVTAISNVFIFKNVVYKIYKSDNQFFNENFNDLSQKSGRFTFTRKDFEWNNKLSPEIYTELKGVTLDGDTAKFTESSDESEELVIVMNKVSASDGLLKKLIDNRISKEDCHQIGFQLGQRIIKIQRIFPYDLYDDFIPRYKDLVAWATGVKEVPVDEAKKYLDYVKKFLESHREEFKNSKDLVGLCLDIHADNAAYINGTLLPMDTYSPKEDWLHGYRFINIYRVASDIYAFLGKDAFEEVLCGYEEATKEKLPREQDKFLIIYCELIMWPYQYMLSEKEKWRIDIAEKYHSFLRDIFENT